MTGEASTTRPSDHAPPAAKAKPWRDLLKRICGFTKKHWGVILSNVIAMTALSVSFASSARSNRIAEDALSTSRKQFLQTNRPYVVLSPRKFENGRYYTVERQGEMLAVGFEFDVENVGNVAARDVDIPDRMLIGLKKLEEDARVFPLRKEISPVTLSPGQSFVSMFSLKLEHKSIKEAKRGLEHFSSEDSEGFLIKYSVEYRSEVDESRRYESSVTYRFRGDQRQLLKMEMSVLEAD